MPTTVTRTKFTLDQLGQLFLEFRDETRVEFSRIYAVLERLDNNVKSLKIEMSDVKTRLTEHDVRITDHDLELMKKASQAEFTAACNQIIAQLKALHSPK